MAKRSVICDRISVTFNESEGADPTVLLVHGAGANRNYWKALDDALSGRATVAPDLYGHGGTPAWKSVSRSTPSYSYRDDVPLLESVLALRNPPFDLVGHSSGGSVCLEYAREFPKHVRRLVLIEPMLPTMLQDFDAAAWAEVSGAYRDVHHQVKKGQFGQAARHLFEYILGDGQWNALPEKIRTWMTENVETTLEAHSDASLALPTDPTEYAGLRIPTLVIYGEHTRVPYQRIAERMAQLLNGRLERISDASHNSPLTHAQAVNQLVCEFIR